MKCAPLRPVIVAGRKRVSVTLSAIERRESWRAGRTARGGELGGVTATKCIERERGRTEGDGSRRTGRRRGFPSHGHDPHLVPLYVRLGGETVADLKKPILYSDSEDL